MNEYDSLSKAPLNGLIIRLAIPAAISMLVTTVYNMADTWFVSRLGTSASGATGVVFGLMSLLQAAGFMFGQGAGSIISRSLGAGDRAKAERIAAMTFAVSLAAGAVIAVAGIVFIVPLMRVLGSTPTILVFSRKYALWILLAAPFLLGSHVLNNILRFEGKAALAMAGLASGACLNLIGDPVLIFGCRLGITGAGISTAVSQAVSFAILLYMFSSGRSGIRLSVKNLSFRFSELADVCGTGFPSFVRQGMNSVTAMVLNYYAASLGGDAAVAAMSIVGRVNFALFAVGLGLGQGYQPVCAFNYGAGNYERVRKGYFFTWRASQMIITLLAAAGIVFAREIVEFFRNDPRVIEIGTLALRLQVAALLCAPYQVSGNMLLQSTGQKLAASALSLLKNGLYFIVLASVFTRIWGLLGLQMAQPSADVLTALTTIPFVTGFLRRLKKNAPQGP
ncbi:MAG: MATE family efflux transporter [Abditibacteriota bacterium]|nr:MATE family efflux transporter [Abditibacteriota bacterium]